MKKVLFVCVRNAGRSQMAEAFFNFMGKGKARAISAGTSPAEQVSSTMVRAMQEVGIKVSDRKPKALTAEMLEGVDKIITMGCNVDEGMCPTGFLPGEDWGIEDPHGKPIEKVREIRDTIKAKVQELIREIGDQ